MYANQKTFNEESMDKPFKEEAKFFWIPVGPQMVEQSFFSIKQGKVNAS